MRQVQVLAVALLVGASALAAGRPERDSTWIDRRVQEWQPTAKERRWEAIGWARDIREAERLAGIHHRPVFLFTHDGRLSVGRC